MGGYVAGSSLGVVETDQQVVVEAVGQRTRGCASVDCGHAQPLLRGDGRTSSIGLVEEKALLRGPANCMRPKY